jgi:ABC-2 type transport system ATP-binding protein
MGQVGYRVVQLLLRLGESVTVVTVQPRNLAAAQQVLVSAGYTAEMHSDRLILYEPRAIAAPEQVASILVSAGVPPSRLAVEQEVLEEYFLRLTGEPV